MMRISSRELKTLGFREYIDNRVRREVYPDVFIEYHEDEGIYLSHYHEGKTIAIAHLKHVNTMVKLNRIFKTTFDKAL